MCIDSGLSDIYVSEIKVKVGANCLFIVCASMLLLSYSKNGFNIFHVASDPCTLFIPKL